MWEHANYALEDPTQPAGSNPEASCCELTMETTIFITLGFGLAEEPSVRCLWTCAVLQAMCYIRSCEQIVMIWGLYSMWVHVHFWYIRKGVSVTIEEVSQNLGGRHDHPVMDSALFWIWHTPEGVSYRFQTVSWFFQGCFDCQNGSLNTMLLAEWLWIYFQKNLTNMAKNTLLCKSLRHSHFPLINKFCYKYLFYEFCSIEAIKTLDFQA